MIESILRLRQMMAELKLSEAEVYSYALIHQEKTPERREVLSLYLEILLQQKKSLPPECVLELVELEMNQNLDQAITWFSHLTESETKKYRRQFQLINIQISAAKGRIDTLHTQISNFQLYLYEKRVPAVPDLINNLINKYFKKDFHLNLQRLSLSLMLHDLKGSELILKDLILSSIERASPKGIKEKLGLIVKILEANSDKGFLDIYRQLCVLMCEGIQDRKDYKKLAELVIYFDDFKFQAIILDFIHQSQLTDMAAEYSVDIRSNPEYDFVFFEKYFSHLKSYFVSPREKVRTEEFVMPEIDLELEDDIPKNSSTPHIADRLDEEAALINLFKYQNYSANDLLEIAVSFLQSELPQVALKASELAIEVSGDERTLLKSTYLKLTCLLLLGDNRTALEMAITARGLARTQDDILSFMYGEAEAYMRLSRFKECKKILLKIMTIDADYRLTRERLEKLDEI